MKLDDLKKMNIPKGNIVEFYVPALDKPIMLRYYETLVETPNKYRKEEPKTPYIKVWENKEKHGCFQGPEEYSLEDIRWLANKGKSSVSELHAFN